MGKINEEGEGMLQFLMSLLNKKSASSGSFPQAPYQQRQPFGRQGAPQQSNFRYPPRPRAPQNNYPQGMRPRMGNPRMMPPGMNQGRMNMPRSANMNPAQMNQQGGGGLLSKLFNFGGQKGTGGQFGSGAGAGNPFGVGAGSPFGAGAGGQFGAGVGTGAGTGSGMNFPGMLSNAQQALKMAETAMPVIQQYGPMVKNIPQMLTLLKEFNNLEDADEATDELENVSDTSESQEQSIPAKEDDSITDQAIDLEKDEEKSENKSEKAQEKGSKAKLYI
jgi:hypothetical protein